MGKGLFDRVGLFGGSVQNIDITGKEKKSEKGDREIEL